MNHKSIFRTKVITTSALGISLTAVALVLPFTSNNSQVAYAANASSYYSTVDASSANSLFKSLVSIESKAKSGSYAALWTIYRTAYKKSDGKIKDYYSDATSYTPGTNQCGSYSNEGDCYNREHSIPKSWWGGSTSGQGADPFIVVPSDGKVNGMRSNYPFGEVSNATYTSKSGCKLGSGKMGSTSIGICFEPMDSVKGDFARIYFYSKVRWPNVNMTQEEGSTVFYSSASSSTNYGLKEDAVTMFLKWCFNDPVDDWEMSVNDAIYSSSTYGNRNPFIDHPEYACKIWGDTNDETKAICKNVTPTNPDSGDTGGDTDDNTDNTDNQDNGSSKNGCRASIGGSSIILFVAGATALGVVIKKKKDDKDKSDK